MWLTHVENISSFLFPDEVIMREFVTYTCVPFLICYRINDLQQQVASITRVNDEAGQTIKSLQRDRDKNEAAERMEIRDKLARVSDDVNKQLLQNELKLREENTKQFQELEDV